ncbi:MAG: hypothetical protein ACR2GR_03255 [Rhodothermales bacterium]
MIRQKTKPISSQSLVDWVEVQPMGFLVGEQVSADAFRRAMRLYLDNHF